MKIWKYCQSVGRIPANGLFTLRMRREQSILSVQPQYGDDLVIWALVNPDAPEAFYTFLAVRTGGEMPESPEGFAYRYLQTVQFHQGDLVLHLFLLEVSDASLDW